MNEICLRGFKSLERQRERERYSHPWEDRMKGGDGGQNREADEEEEEEEESKRRRRHSIEVRGKRPFALFYGN